MFLKVSMFLKPLALFLMMLIFELKPSRIALALCETKVVQYLHSIPCETLYHIPQFPDPAVGHIQSEIFQKAAGCLVIPAFIHVLEPQPVAVCNHCIEIFAKQELIKP